MFGLLRGSSRGGFGWCCLWASLAGLGVGGGGSGSGSGGCLFLSAGSCHSAVPGCLVVPCALFSA